MSCESRKHFRVRNFEAELEQSDSVFFMLNSVPERAGLLLLATPTSKRIGSLRGHFLYKGRR